MNAIPVVVVSENGIPVIPQGGSSPITETDPIYTADKSVIMNAVALANTALQVETEPFYNADKLAIQTSMAKAETALQSENDPIWNAEKGNYDTSSQVNTKITSALTSYDTSNQVTTKISTALTSYDTKTQVDTKITNSLANYYNKAQSDAWASWETAYSGTPASNIVVSNTETDITAFLGVLTSSTFGATPISYDAANNKFIAQATGKSYAFNINYRITGNITGSNLTMFRVNLRRASDNSLVTTDIFYKMDTQTIPMTSENLINILTRVKGDTDPYVTSGFKLSIQRVQGTGTLTISGAQQLFFNK